MTNAEKIKDLRNKLKKLEKLAIADGKIDLSEIEEISKILFELDCAESSSNQEGTATVSSVKEELIKLNKTIDDANSVFKSWYDKYVKILSADATKIIKVDKKIYSSIASSYLNIKSSVNAFERQYGVYRGLLHQQNLLATSDVFGQEKIHALKRIASHAEVCYKDFLIRVQAKEESSVALDKDNSGEKKNLKPLDENNLEKKQEFGLSLGGMNGKNVGVGVDEDGTIKKIGGEVPYNKGKNLQVELTDEGGKVGMSKPTTGDRAVAGSLTITKEMIAAEIGVTKTLWEYEFPSIPLFGPIFLRFTTSGTVSTSAGESINFKENATKLEFKASISVDVGLEIFASGGFVEAGGTAKIVASGGTQIAFVSKPKKLSIETQAANISVKLAFALFVKAPKEIRDAAKKLELDSTLLSINLPLGEVELFVIKSPKYVDGKATTELSWGKGADYVKVENAISEATKAIAKKCQEIKDYLEKQRQAAIESGSEVFSSIGRLGESVIGDENSEKVLTVLQDFETMFPEWMK